MAEGAQRGGLQGWGEAGTVQVEKPKIDLSLLTQFLSNLLHLCYFALYGHIILGFYTAINTLEFKETIFEI